MRLGQGLCNPKSETPHSEFEAEAYILTEEEGGRTVGVVSKIIA